MRNVLLAMALVLAAGPAAAQDKVIVDISNPATRKIAVAVPPLLTGPGVDAAVARKVAETLSWDLDFSGVFDTVDAKAWLADPAKDTLDQPQFKAWYSSGAISLVRGEIKRAGNGYSIELRYYDTVQGKPFALPGGAIGKAYTTGSNPAPAAHAFANLLMELITQKSGPFGSRVVFEYRQPNTSRKDLQVMDLDGANRQPLTKNNLLNLAPAFSPDGKMVVYTSYKRRNPDLYIMNVETGSDEPLSARPGTNSGGAFSPDGKLVAASLSFDGDSEIYLLNVKGEVVKKLTTSSAIDVQPTFSPDGTRLAFTSDRIGNPNVFLMNADGSGVQRLTVNGKYNSSPAWSPTGEWIAYYSRDDGNIWLAKPDGSETKQVTFGEGTNEDPSWSPDGRYVVFSSNRKGTYDLWAVDTISLTTTRLTDLPGDERNPAWGRSFNQ
jgi:TolB protein